MALFNFKPPKVSFFKKIANLFYAQKSSNNSGSDQKTDISRDDKEEEPTWQKSVQTTEATEVAPKQKSQENKIKEEVPKPQIPPRTTATTSATVKAPPRARGNERRRALKEAFSPPVPPRKTKNELNIITSAGNITIDIGKYLENTKSSATAASNNFIDKLTPINLNNTNDQKTLESLATTLKDLAKDGIDVAFQPIKGAGKATKQVGYKIKNGSNLLEALAKSIESRFVNEPVSQNKEAERIAEKSISDEFGSTLESFNKALGEAFQHESKRTIKLANNGHEKLSEVTQNIDNMMQSIAASAMDFSKSVTSAFDKTQSARYTNATKTAGIKGRETKEQKNVKDLVEFWSNLSEPPKAPPRKTKPSNSPSATNGSQASKRNKTNTR